MNDADDIAFVAHLEHGNNVTRDNDVGIWIQPDGMELQLLTREGDLAPSIDGVFTNINIHSLDGPNHKGDVAFIATVRTLDETYHSIWATRDLSEMRLIARTGKPAPGTDGQSMNALFHPQSAHRINDAGEVAFWSSFENPVPGQRDSEGVWISDTSGDLHPVELSSNLDSVAVCFNI